MKLETEMIYDNRKL